MDDGDDSVNDGNDEDDDKDYDDDVEDDGDDDDEQDCVRPPSFPRVPKCCSPLERSFPEDTFPLLSSPEVLLGITSRGFVLGISFPGLLHGNKNSGGGSPWERQARGFSLEAYPRGLSLGTTSSPVILLGISNHRRFVLGISFPGLVHGNKNSDGGSPWEQQARGFSLEAYPRGFSLGASSRGGGLSLE